MKAQRKKGRDTRLENSFWKLGGLERRAVGRWVVPGGKEGVGCWGMERSRIIIMAIIIIIIRGKELVRSLIVGMKMSVRICLVAFGVRLW